MSQLTDLLFDYEPHDETNSAETFEAFHERISIWNGLQAAGIHPILFALVFTLLVSVPNAVLTFWYGFEHPLTTEAMFAVLTTNTVLTFVGLFFADRAFPEAVINVREAFDVEDKRYYGFFGRLFERLYHWSFFAPFAKGPHGRTQRPLFWVLLVGNYVFWAIVVGVVMLNGLPASTAGTVLAVTYLLFIAGWASTTLFTVVCFNALIFIYLSIRIAQFPIKLNLMRVSDRFGLEPFGRFIFKILIIALATIFLAGAIGLYAWNELMIVFAAMATPLVLLFFVGMQYGIHRGIIRTKQSRLQKIHEEHADDLDRIYCESTPEPEVEAISQSKDFITLKEEIEALPNWPTDTRTVYQVVSASVLSNLPSLPFIPGWLF